MNVYDFLIGLTLVNAIPHFVLGTWKGRMLSGFGISDRGNILYSLLNFSISSALFLFRFGVSGLPGHPIYLGGLFVVVAYFIFGKFLYVRYHRNFYRVAGAGD